MRRRLGLVKSMQRSRYPQHILARDVAAELGEVPRRMYGDARDDLQRPINQLAESSELFPDLISEPSRFAHHVERLFWQPYGRVDLNGLNGIAHKMAYEQAVAERLMDALPDEVNWALYSVANIKVRGVGINCADRRARVEETDMPPLSMSFLRRGQWLNLSCGTK